MTPDAKNCLIALSDLTNPDGEICVPWAPLMEATGLTRQVLRRNVRALARKGLAEYFRGLSTEDGAFAGAGYCITKQGRSTLFIH